jgi:NADH-quinone oxidoreductase subunit J
MSYPAFFLLAIPLVLAAIGVIVNPHPIRSALSLVATLFLLAVVFLFLGAHLVGALQIIVYGGAIMVLFLFVIMLLNLQRERTEGHGRGVIWLSAVAGTLFALVLAYFLGSSSAGVPGPGMDVAPPDTFGSTAAVGERLFTHFLLPFEITSILLLVAVIGAVVIAKRKVS